MTSPSSPGVHVTRVTCAPSAAYFAMIPPVQIDSSSGWACTSSNRRPPVCPLMPRRVPSGTRQAGFALSGPFRRYLDNARIPPPLLPPPAPSPLVLILPHLL